MGFVEPLFIVVVSLALLFTVGVGQRSRRRPSDNTNQEMTNLRDFQARELYHSHEGHLYSDSASAEEETKERPVPKRNAS